MLQQCWGGGPGPHYNGFVSHQAQKAVGEALAAATVPAGWQVHKATGGKLNITSQMKQQVWGPIKEARRNDMAVENPICGRYHSKSLHSFKAVERLPEHSEVMVEMQDLEKKVGSRSQ